MRKSNRASKMWGRLSPEQRLSQQARRWIQQWELSMRGASQSLQRGVEIHLDSPQPENLDEPLRSEVLRLLGKQQASQPA